MAARNLGQLRQAVEDFGFGTDLASAQNGWINAEYRILGGMRRWKWLEARTTVGIVQGFSAVTPSATDIRNIDRVYIADLQGNDFLLTWKPTQWVVEKQHRFNQVTDQAPPRYWTQFAGQILVYPIPDASYTLQIDYVKNVTALVADIDVPLVPEAYDDILVWGAVARGAVRQNNWLTRDFASQQRQQVVNEMLAEYAKDQTQNADEVEQTGIWSSGMPWR